jgi:oxysterol-binding protein-related protein 9/10/11
MSSEPGTQTIITCSGGKGEQLRAIIEYKEEVCYIYRLVPKAFSHCGFYSQPWLGAPRFLLEGIIYKYTEGPEQDAWTKVRQVPKDLVVATFEGCWRKAVTWKRVGSVVSI